MSPTKKLFLKSRSPSDILFLVQAQIAGKRRTPERKARRLMSMRHMALLTMALLMLMVGTASSADGDGAIGIWELTPSFVSGSALKAALGLSGEIKGPVTFVDGPYGKALYFDGTDNSIVLHRGAPGEIELPVKELTIQAWIRIDAQSSWKGVLGYAQDNGSFERGFYISVEYGKIGGYVATKRDGGTPRLDWVASEESYDGSKWHQVAFTYDGSRMELYIDGVMVRDSVQAYGEVAYAEYATFAIGAYVDDNENEPFQGAIREIRLYSRALTEQEVKASVPGMHAVDAPLKGQQGTAKVMAVLRDGTVVTGTLLDVVGEEILIDTEGGDQRRINLSQLLAILPAAH